MTNVLAGDKCSGGWEYWLRFVQPTRSFYTFALLAGARVGTPVPGHPGTHVPWYPGFRVAGYPDTQVPVGVHSFNIIQIRLNRIELEQFYCFPRLYFFVFHVFTDVLPTSHYFRLKIRIPLEILRRMVYSMSF